MTAALRPGTEITDDRDAPPPSMIDRMTLIMDVFERSTTRLTLEEIAHRTGLARSTAHRILNQLSRQQWVRHAPAGYGLGPRALDLGDRSVGHGALRAAAAPTLHQLALDSGLVVHLAVLHDAEVHYLDKVGGRPAADVPSRVGGRAPAHSTALGKAMAAWLLPEQVEARFTGRLDRFTDHTITSMVALRQELERIRRRRGLTFERGERFPGIGCVAVALPGPDGAVGAISLVGDARASLERVAPLVVAAARRISAELDRDGARAADDPVSC
jgi:DNA-binding IclR family transcriptional regulator